MSGLIFPSGTRLWVVPTGIAVSATLDGLAHEPEPKMLCGDRGSGPVTTAQRTGPGRERPHSGPGGAVLALSGDLD